MSSRILLVGLTHLPGVFLFKITIEKRYYPEAILGLGALITSLFVPPLMDTIAFFQWHSYSFLRFYHFDEVIEYRQGYETWKDLYVLLFLKYILTQEKGKVTCLFLWCRFGMTPGNWHRLDNVFAITTFSILFSFLCQIRDPTLHSSLRWIGLLVGLVCQEKGPWQRIFSNLFISYTWMFLSVCHTEEVNTPPILQFPWQLSRLGLVPWHM